jgi:hypothetical protein
MTWRRNRPRSPELTREQALRCIPVRNREIGESRLENGEVILDFPVAARPWVAAVARWLGADANRPQRGKLQLDRLGTRVWDLLDGVRPMARIVSAFADEHGLEAKEAEVAVTRYVRELGRRGLVGLR